MFPEAEVMLEAMSMRAHRPAATFPAQSQSTPEPRERRVAIDLDM